MTEGKAQKEKPLVSWEIAIKEENNTNTLYIVAFFVFAILLAVYAFFSKNILSGAVSVVAVLSLIWYVFVQKNIVKISIVKSGVWIDQTFYSFEKIKDHTVSERENAIYLITKNIAIPNIVLPLGKKKATDIGKYLPKAQPKKVVEKKGIIGRFSGALKNKK